MAGSRRRAPAGAGRRTAAAAEPGLRERKRQRTRATIQAEALRLIAEQGYEATTCDQIAAAADVSPATFYRYFPTKEDVVLADEYDDLLVGLLQDRPEDEPPVRAVRRSVAASLDAIYAADVEIIRERLRLVLSVPALRARRYEQTRATEELLAPAVGARMGAAASQLEVRAVTAAIVGAVVTAVEHWAAHGGALPALIDEALAALEGHAARRK
ncbi:MAG: TetR family transcriptional regulator [Actinobacteria bacterium]|nr:TetR family transcriptional regulator [Actinomycetota bacterium]